jgi:lysophospholipid acyltransferase (LPLAT)-like uncharacterized protein
MGGVSASGRLARVDQPASPSGHAIEAVGARALHRYLRSLARCGVARYVDDGGRLLDPGDVRRALAPRADGRPLLPVYWGADAVAIALLPFLEATFLEAAQRLTFLFDETFGGRVCAGLVAQLGSQSVMLARAGRPERLEHLSFVMRRGGSFALAVDGGGPYFRVGTGVASLARALKAVVVPLACTATPAVPWLHRSGISFPLPRCRVTAAIGRPIDASRPRQTVVEEIQAALDSLGHIVRSPVIPSEGRR